MEDRRKTSEISEQRIQQWITDVALAVNQSTKSENSGLVGDIKKNITSLQETVRVIPESRERITKLEVNTTNLMEKLLEFQSDNKEAQKENKEAHKEILISVEKFHATTNESIREMTEKLDNALEKKAGRWVEKVIFSIGGFIGFGILSYLGRLIYLATIHIN